MAYPTHLSVFDNLVGLRALYTGGSIDLPYNSDTTLSTCVFSDGSILRYDMDTETAQMLNASGQPLTPSIDISEIQGFQELMIALDLRLVEIDRNAANSQHMITLDLIAFIDAAAFGNRSVQAYAEGILESVNFKGSWDIEAAHLCHAMSLAEESEAVEAAQRDLWDPERRLSRNIHSVSDKWEKRVQYHLGGEENGSSAIPSGPLH